MATFRTEPLEGEVELRQSSIGQISAGEVEIEQSAVRSVSAQHVEIEQSAVAFAQASHVRIDSSAVAVVVSGQAVEATNVRALLVLSPIVRGNVRTLFDLRTAFAIGLGYYAARKAITTLALLARALPSISRH